MLRYAQHDNCYYTIRKANVGLYPKNRFFREQGLRVDVTTARATQASPIGIKLRIEELLFRRGLFERTRG